MANDPIKVEEIGITFTHKGWRNFADFVTFPGNLGQLFPDIPPIDTPENIHKLTKQLFDRMWPSDRAGFVIVENITMTEKNKRGQLYLVRPAMDGAMMAGYGIDAGIPGFQCILQNGRFLVVGFECGFYSDEVTEGIILNGMVYMQPGLISADQTFNKTRPPKPFSNEVLAILTSLISKRLIVARKLDEWEAFLDWELNLVRQRQLGLLYSDVEIDESSRCLRFVLSATEELWKKFKGMRPFGLSVMPLSASKNQAKWEPVENARGVSLGDFCPPKKQINILLSSNQNNGEILTDIIEVHPDPDIWEKCHRGIPEQGFLADAIYQNEIPIKRLKEALQKLIRAEAANPRLADFLFDATKACVPDAPVLGLDEADWVYLQEVAPNLKLNEKQKLAVAKALAAPDIFCLQGPPGTGKTRVLAAVCVLLVKRGMRVLVSSQSNVAVNNILKCLPKDLSIRRLRIGRKDSESGFSEDQAPETYMTLVHDICEKVLNDNRKLAADVEQLEQLWPWFTDMVSNYNKLKKTRSATQKKINTTNSKIASLGETISKLKEQSSVYLSAIDVLEQTSRQLDNSLPITDRADWVCSIDMDQRADVFDSLKTWRQNVSLPETLQKLLAKPQQDNDEEKEEVAGNSKSWIRKLKGWFRRKPEYIQTPEKKQPLQEEFEPNWAVEWLNAIVLLNRLQEIQLILPGLLESCMEVERVTASAAVSGISAEEWSKVTGDLHHSLKSCQSITPILGLDDIATSLKPKRKFGRKLAQARSFLQEAIINIPPVADRLQKTLTEVTEASLTYLSNSLAKIDKQLQQALSSLDSVKRKQNGLTETLTSINSQIERFHLAWSETFNLLPADLRGRINDAPVPISRDGLQILDKVLASYKQDIQQQLNDYQLWGSVQDRWIGLLKHRTKIDKSKMGSMYLNSPNVIGISCSWCGNRKRFLNEYGQRVFDVVIIDEVSKATPPELLMPALLAKKIILGGDYRQLPPVFKEGRNLERSFHDLTDLGVNPDQLRRFNMMITASLFKQLYNENSDMVKQYLDVQFRMHPQIMKCDNEFYFNALRCGIKNPDEKCDHNLRIRTDYGDFLTRENHVIWVDTSCDSKGDPAYEKQAGMSKINVTEVEGTIRLAELMNEAAGQAGKIVELGIITFYGRQVFLIKNKLDKLKSNHKKFLKVSISTVDDFQGLEMDCIILSLVRSKKGRIGNFAKQFGRINVAMSRAKKLLVIFGAEKTFRNIKVPLPTKDGKIVHRTSYGNIIDIVGGFGGKRNMKDLIKKG